MTEQKMKRCSKGDNCVHPDGCLQPATNEYFRKCKDCKDGLRGACKACQRERSRQWRKENAEYVREYQRQYYKENTEQLRERSRQYYKENTEQFRERNRQWRKENAERKREYDRQWRKENAEYVREYKRQWHKDNAEHRREYHRQWRKENAERKREYDRQYHKENAEKARARSHNYRARKHNLSGTLTDEQIQRCLEYWDYSCAVCGTPQDMFIKLELDHVEPLTDPNSAGTVATNIIPLCNNRHGFVSHTACNQSKGNRDLVEWLQWRFEDEADAIYQRIMDYFDWVREQDE